MSIRIDPVLEAFGDALELVEDHAQRERFKRVVSAGRASVERTVHDLIAEVVADVNAALSGDAQVDLRYQAGGLSVEVNRRPPDGVAEEDEFSLGGDLERLTLRLPSELKDRATAAAAEAALSLNSWLVRTLARSVTQSLRESARDLERGARRTAREAQRESRRALREQRRRVREKQRQEERGRGGQLKGWIGD